MANGRTVYFNRLVLRRETSKKVSKMSRSRLVDLYTQEVTALPKKSRLCGTMVESGLLDLSMMMMIERENVDGGPYIENPPLLT